MRSFIDFDFVNLALMPMFLFSATFFPLSRYPQLLQWVVQATPLYQGVALERGLVFGELELDDAGERGLPPRAGPGRPPDRGTPAADAAPALITAGSPGRGSPDSATTRARGPGRDWGSGPADRGTPTGQGTTGTPEQAADANVAEKVFPGPG